MVLFTMLAFQTLPVTRTSQQALGAKRQSNSNSEISFREYISTVTVSVPIKSLSEIKEMDGWNYLVVR